ncbi:TTC28 [Branchiostoma lanceolatum]|uniref:TTC28 protein n=1 Tax=Branchiostoma lanceolatum TaxID=7740 RepID=A0A8J9W6I6_BRALA|nr:TTC28 [Branchiostoma lanceolatum]
MKSLGDLHLEVGKLCKDSAEFDKAAALYAAALLRCTDPDMGQTLEDELEHSKLCRELLEGHTPQFQWQSPDYWGTVDSNVLRVAEICDKFEKSTGNTQHSIEQTYTEIFVTAIRNSDISLEVEVLKSLGDLYLEKGQKTSDASQFSKAAAMYNKALTRCGDPETRLTLEHRIGYMENTREAATKQSSSTKSTGGKKRLHGGHQLGDITGAADNRQDQHIYIHTARAYTDHLREGDSSLARADLDSAEQHFAAALKMVHVRDPTAQQYQREVEPLCKLGDVYSKRGQQTGDGGDFVKAAALYNAAIARQGVTEKHKKQLKEMRDQIKLEMETIDQQLDPYVHDEDDPCVKEIEAKRAQAVRHLFENIAQQRKEFISLLVEECIGFMGPPPCKYALIGLGSQATGLVTPYSDLEFAILVEEETQECLAYFCKLTHYLHLKVVDLGETILPAMGIKSLNDFYSENPLDNWYYDSVTPRGFTFDGSMPKASKTPLGRQGDFRLEGFDFYDNSPRIMGMMCNELCKDSLAISYFHEALRIAEDTGTGIKEKMNIFINLGGAWLNLGDYKKAISFYEQALDMHRSIDGQGTTHANIALLLNNLGIAWNKLGDSTKAISYHDQSLSTAHNDIVGSLNNLGMAWRNLGYYRKAISYFELALQMYRSIDGQGIAHTTIAYLFNNLGSTWSFQGESRKAISYYKQALQMYKSIYGGNTAHPSIALLLNNMGQACRDLDDPRKAINYLEQALQMYKSIYGKTAAHPDIATTLNSIGSVWNCLEDHQKAISYAKNALQMRHSIYGQKTLHPEIARSLNSIGVVLADLGDPREAISYLEQSIQMYRGIYGQATEHPDIALSLENMGSAWQRFGDHRKAISYYEQALRMARSTYGQPGESLG